MEFTAAQPRSKRGGNQRISPQRARRARRKSLKNDDEKVLEKNSRTCTLKQQRIKGFRTTARHARENGIHTVFWIPASAGMTMIGFHCSL
jgi:hypothetical protein